MKNTTLIATVMAVASISASTAVATAAAASGNTWDDPRIAVNHNEVLAR